MIYFLTLIGTKSFYGPKKLKYNLTQTHNKMKLNKPFYA